MSEQVYVITCYDLYSSNPQEVIGVARTYEAAVLIALEWFDEPGATVNINEPGATVTVNTNLWADIETFDLVG